MSRLLILDVHTDKLDKFQTFDSPSQSPILTEEFQSYIYENSPSFSKKKCQEDSKEDEFEDIHSSNQNLVQESNQKESRLSEELENVTQKLKNRSNFALLQL